MESKGALLTVAIPLLAFKVWFAILLLVYAPKHDTMVWIAATHWPLLLIVPAVVVAAIPVYRMLKVRARREQLKRAEFMVTPSPGTAQCPALWETVSRLEGGD
jgi:putative effector of murein hydrolase